MSKFKQVQTSLLYAGFPRKIRSLTHVNDSAVPNIIDGVVGDTPCLVYMANGRIHDLEKLKHTKADRDYLNEHGLNIYLYEPLCSYYTEDPCALHGRVFNMGFYSEFPNKNAGYLDVHAAELDSIEEYVKRNKLYSVVVHTGDYKVDVHYQPQSLYMDLKCNDLFLKKQSFSLDVNSRKKVELTKKFISTNWRFTPARAAVSALLCKKQVNLAWYFTIDRDILTHSPWFDYDVAKQHPKFYKAVLLNIDRLNASSPWYLDMPTKSALDIKEPGAHFYPQIPDHADFYNPVFHNNNTLSLQDYYRESFVDIVCESRYAQPTGNLSEKTFQPIQYMTPFILVAPPFSLEYLKSLGFETFSKWWDESYDSEISHMERLIKIYKIIEYIDSFSITELYEVYLEMLPVLRKNHDVLKKLLKNNQTSCELAEILQPDSLQWITKDHNIDS